MQANRMIYSQETKAALNYLALVDHGDELCGIFEMRKKLTRTEAIDEAVRRVIGDWLPLLRTAYRNDGCSRFVDPQGNFRDLVVSSVRAGFRKIMTEGLC